jgi:hypothetical protein
MAPETREAGKLPKAFSNLQNHADRWALPTMALRHEQRLATSQALQREFYDAFLPVFEEAIDYLGSYPFDQLPEDAQTLLNLCLAMVDISLSIEVFGEHEGPHADLARRITVLNELSR